MAVRKKPKRGGGKKAGAAASGDAVTSPMQGTIVKIVVEEGQQVAEGDTVVVLEAMKMEQPLKAHKSGTVTGLQAEVGATVDQRRGDLRDHGLTSTRGSLRVTTTIAADAGSPAHGASATFRPPTWVSHRPPGGSA